MFKLSCNIQGCSHETPAFKLESVFGELRAAALQSCVFIRAFGAKRYEWVDGSRLGPAGGNSGNTLGTRRDEGREDAVEEPHWDWQVVGSTPSRVRLKSLELVPFASLIGPQRSGWGGWTCQMFSGPALLLPTAACMMRQSLELQLFKLCLMLN